VVTEPKALARSAGLRCCELAELRYSLFEINTARAPSLPQPEQKVGSREVPFVLRLVEGPQAAQPAAHPSHGEALSL
jgi:hypothetical protein